MELTIPALALLALLASPTSTHAQGVNWQENLSWSAIQAKAKAENKYIFIDGFTTWCGPCKMMREQILTQPEAGTYFNDKFISVGVQLDTSAKDDKHVRGWYADAHDIMVEYNIRAFPTFLILSPGGRPLNRIVGGRTPASAFIAAVDESFDSTKQYYTKLQQFRDGRRDDAFLRKLALQAIKTYDKDNGREVASTYFDHANIYSRDALELLEKYTESSRDPGFALFVQHPMQIDSILGPGAAARHITEALMLDYIEPALRGRYEPSWKALQHEIAGSYPDQAGQTIARGKIFYYQMRQLWHPFGESVSDYIRKYDNGLSPEELTGFAHIIVSKCDEKKCLEMAAEWESHLVHDRSIPYYMEVYATLLYKLGNKDDALVWEQKALAVAGARAKAHYQENIDKMQRGEKTWD